MKKIIELEGMKGECNTGQEEKEGISEFLLNFFFCLMKIDILIPLPDLNMG